MIEQLPDMPPATIGFRVAGEIERKDYEEVLAPELRRALETGTGLRTLYVIEDLPPGATTRRRDVDRPFLKGRRRTDHECLTNLVAHACQATAVDHEGRRGPTCLRDHAACNPCRRDAHRGRHEAASAGR
jgi:hypothetical protein